MDTIKLSTTAASAQQIVFHGLFPTQLAPFSRSKACALLDTDGCVCISYSGGRMSSMVMWAQSNVAALSVLAHSMAQLGIPISGAAMHKVHDSSTGRYVHDEKVHLLLHRGSSAALLAALLREHSCMNALQGLLAQQWSSVAGMGDAAPANWQPK